MSLCFLKGVFLRTLSLWSAFLVLFSIAPWVQADQVHVAVASNFSGAMKSLVEQFEYQTEHDVVLSFGSSGKMLAQIQNGAPYDVFLSADQAKPMALEASGEALQDTRFTYAIGALALWSSDADLIDQSPAALLSGQFNKLALANPKLAPYGYAASEVLNAMGLTESTQAHWVMGENISQTYQFVASGNADLGFVALSQIMNNGAVTNGSSWLVPKSLYHPIRQDAVLLKRGQDNLAAKDLLAFLKSPAAIETIHRFGYETE